MSLLIAIRPFHSLLCWWTYTSLIHVYNDLAFFLSWSTGPLGWIYEIFCSSRSIASFRFCFFHSLPTATKKEISLLFDFLILFAYRRFVSWVDKVLLRAKKNPVFFRFWWYASLFSLLMYCLLRRFFFALKFKKCGHLLYGGLVIGGSHSSHIKLLDFSISLFLFFLLVSTGNLLFRFLLFCFEPGGFCKPKRVIKDTIKTVGLGQNSVVGTLFPVFFMASLPPLWLFFFIFFSFVFVKSGMNGSWRFGEGKNHSWGGYKTFRWIHWDYVVI